MAVSSKYQLSRYEGKRSILWLKLMSFALKPGQLAHNQHVPPSHYKNQQTRQWKDYLLRTNKLMSYPLVWYGLLYTRIHSTNFSSRQSSNMMQQKLDDTRLRTDLGQSVWSVKCQQTGVDIDNPTPHNSLTINWVRISCHFGISFCSCQITIIFAGLISRPSSPK